MRLLDLFGGAQGCGVGYARAGFDVVSIDIEPHDKHPEIDAALVDDALAVLGRPAYLSRFDAIHASPPCQAHTTMSNRWRGTGGRADEHVSLIAEVRDALEVWGGSYVIENVPGARKQLRSPITLSGGMFGLGVHRPRLFESNVPLNAPPSRKVDNPIGVYGKAHDGRRLWTRADGSSQRAAASLAEGKAAMGIDWMSWRDLTEAVPPAYTEHIGLQLMAALKERAA